MLIKHELGEAEAKELLQLCLDYTPTALAICDRQGDYLATSHQWDTHIGEDNSCLLTTDTDRWQACLAGEAQHWEEQRLHPSTGQPQTVRWQMHPWWRDNGTCRGAIAIAEVNPADSLPDNTLSKPQSFSLAQNNPAGQTAADGFHLLFENAAIGMALFEPQGDRILSANRALCDMLGFSPTELAGKDFAEISHPEDRQPGLNLAREFARTAQPNATLEKRYLTKNNQTLWCNLQVNFIRLPDGSITYGVATLENITPRKSAIAVLQQYREELEDQVAERTAQLQQTNEELLYEIRQRQQAQAELDLFFNLSVDLLCIADRPGYFQRLNPAWETTLGYSIAELMAKPILEWVHPEDAEATAIALEQLAQGESVVNFENRYLAADGSEKWLTWNAVSVESQSVIMAVARDVTERKQAEATRSELIASLQEREEFLRSIYDGTESAIFVVDVLDNGQFQYAGFNRANENITSVSRQQVRGKTPEEFFPPDIAAAVSHNYARCVASGTSLTYEECLPFQGVESWWLTTLNPLRDRHGRIYRMVGTSTEITPLKQAEAEKTRLIESFQHSEERFRAIFEQAAVGMAQVKKDGSWLRVNQHLCHIVGYTKEELLARTFADITHPDDLEVSCRWLHKLWTQEVGTYCLEKRYIHKSGAVVWINLTVSLVQDSEEEPCAIAAIEDISDRKQAEIALRVSEATNRSLLSAIPDLMFRIRADGTFVDYKDAAEHGLLLPPEAFIGKNVADVMPPMVAEPTLAGLRSALATGETQLFEYQLPDENGQLRDYEARLVKIQAVEDGDSDREVLILVRDISDRKQAVRQLKESERRFRAIFNSTFQFIGLLEPDGTVLEVNQTALDFSGQQHGELTGHPFWESRGWRNVPDSQACLKRSIARASQGELVRDEALLCGADGTRMTVDFSLKPVFDSCGNVVLLIAEGRDISDRKALERELLWRDALWNAFFNAVPAGLAIIDDELRFVKINETLARVNRKSPSAHLGKTLAEVLPEFAPTLQPVFEQVLHTGEPILHVEGASEHPDRPGEFEHWLASYFPLATVDGQMRGVGVVTLDISDRKQAEEAQHQSEARERQKAQALQHTLKKLQKTQSQLIQSEKMASLGQLVAGVAHEINNPVNFIYGNLEPLHQYMEDLLALIHLYQEHYPDPVDAIQSEIEAIELDFLEEDLPQILRSMQMGADRIREIVLSLRTFSRLDESDMKPLNLHEGIESTLLILNGRLKAKGNKLGIRTIKEYGELPEVECNGGQINQVFMNIITNGIDALESASKNPEFLNSQPDSASFVPTIRIRTAMKGKGHVEIRISDNGPGIPTEYRSRLFDPFFTTKAVGKGTGLGLAISYQIVVDKHGGRLDYQSQPGKGTEFAIVLPLRQKRKRNGET